MHKIIENVTVTIDQLVPGGQGIATLENGKKAFFWNALPGEIVTSFEIFKKKSQYIEATALTITNPSPHRIPPRDNVYLSTSPWQIFDYTYELEQKLTLLQETFRQAGLACPAKRVRTDGHQYHYRNKMEYSLYWDLSAACIKLAFKKRGTHRKIPITTSSLEHPEIYQKAQTIINDLNLRGAEARTYQSLLLRANQSGQVSGGLYQNHQPHPDFPPLHDRILGATYTYSPNGFFQINLPLYEMALTEIKQHINTPKVLDLYAGVGTIGLSVAKDRELTLVEVDQAAYQELQNNVAPYPKLRPLLAKSEDVTDLISGANETVIIDPPRSGCHQKLLAAFLAKQPETIIYLSCNPSTQARDLKILSSKYTITKIIPYNFFPRTPHLENLAILKLQ